MLLAVNTLTPSYRRLRQITFILTSLKSLSPQRSGALRARNHSLSSVLPSLSFPSLCPASLVPASCQPPPLPWQAERSAKILEPRLWLPLLLALTLTCKCLPLLTFPPPHRAPQPAPSLLALSLAFRTEPTSEGWGLFPGAVGTPGCPGELCRVLHASWFLSRTTGEHLGGAGLATGFVGGRREWTRVGATEKVAKFDLEQQVGVTR